MESDSKDVASKDISTPPLKQRIFAISDIHTEFYDSAESVFNSINWPDADILVLAGDVGNPTTKLGVFGRFISLCSKKYGQVIYVPGNHEYYGCNFDRKSVDHLIELTCEMFGVHFLNRKSVVVNGIRFIGDTMWSLINAKSTRLINDFNRGVFAHQVDYVGEFIDGYRFIQKELLESMNGSELNPKTEPVVVVTHHLPTRRLIHPKFDDYPGNSAFYSDVLDSLKITPNCLLWFCGHTHEFGITNLPNGKCIANPLGYPGEKRVSSVQTTVYTIDMTTKKLLN